MSFQGLPIRAHQDRILHRVAALLRDSPHGLSDWTDGRIYVLADLHTRPDVRWPCILVASDNVSWTLEVGGLASRRAGVAVTAAWEEHGQTLTGVADGSSVEVPDAIMRTLTADSARILLPPGEAQQSRSWGILESIQTVYWNQFATERDRGEAGEEEIVLTGRVLTMLVEYSYDVDLETGHPPGLSDLD